MSSCDNFDVIESPVLIKNLVASDEVVSKMKQRLEYVEKMYLESDNNSCYVGDSDSFDRLHLYEEFYWLNSEVEKLLREFVDIYHIDDTQCNFYIQKSWPVFLKNEATGVNAHTHPNSHISFVYYLQVEDDNETGRIHFQCSQDHWNNTVPFESSSKFIQPNNNLCLMFPSSLVHWVEEYLGDAMRISITYDISITTKLINGATKKEMIISDPSIWKKLNG